MPDHPIAKFYKKPIALALIILGIVFLIEVLLMVTLPEVLEISMLQLAFFDAAILTILITPTLFIFFFLPLRKHIQALEKANRKNEQLWKASITSQQLGRVGTWHIDFNGPATIWTEETCPVLKVPGGTRIDHRSFLNMIYPEDKRAVQKSWIAAHAGENFDLEHRIFVNGDYIWVRVILEMEFGGRGEPVGGVCFIQDITEIKTLHEKLCDQLNWQRPVN